MSDEERGTSRLSSILSVVHRLPPAGGDADPGNKKEHLNPTPGDFVADTTI